MSIFFPLRAKRRACISPIVWWLCLILGVIACVYGLFHSTSPSFATRITAVGSASHWMENDVRGNTRFAFRFSPKDGSPVTLETKIIVPHWGSSEISLRRTLRIVYLDDAVRNPSNEAIDIQILNGDNAGWHDSLDARPFGIWLAIPIGAAVVAFGAFGLKYREDDTRVAGDDEFEPGVVSS